MLFIRNLVLLFLAVLIPHSFNLAMEEKKRKRAPVETSQQPHSKKICKQKFIQKLYYSLRNANWETFQDLLAHGIHFHITYDNKRLLDHAVRWFTQSIFTPLIYLLSEGMDDIDPDQSEKGAVFYNALVNINTIELTDDRMERWSHWLKKTLLADERILSQISDYSLVNFLKKFTEPQSPLTVEGRFWALARELIAQLLEYGEIPSIDEQDFIEKPADFFSSKFSLIELFLMEGGELQGKITKFVSKYENCMPDVLIKYILLDQQKEAIKRIDVLVQEMREGNDAKKYLQNRTLFNRALMLAVGQGQLRIVENLLNMHVFDGNTLQRCLQAAAGRGRGSMVNLLLNLLIELNDEHGSTRKSLQRAFVRASAQGHSQIIEIIVQRCEQIITNETISRSIYRASQRGHLAVMHRLFLLARRKLCEEEQLAVFNQALLRAVMAKQIDIVDFILRCDIVYFNFSLDLNLAGNRVRNSLGNMRLERDVRTAYGRILDVLRRHVLTRRTHILIGRQEDQENNVFDRLPTETHYTILDFYRRRPGMTRDILKRIFTQSVEALGPSSD